MSAEALNPQPRLVAVADHRERVAMLLRAKQLVQKLANGPRYLIGQALRAVRRLLGTNLGTWLTRIPVMLGRAWAVIRSRLGVTGAISLGITALGNATLRGHLIGAGSAIASGLSRVAVNIGRTVESLLRKAGYIGNRVADWFRARLTQVHRLWVRVSNETAVRARAAAGVLAGVWAALNGIARTLLIDRLTSAFSPSAAMRAVVQLVLLAVAVMAPSGPDPDTKRDLNPAAVTVLRPAAGTAVEEEREHLLSALDLAENRAARRARQREEARQRRHPLSD